MEADVKYSKIIKKKYIEFTSVDLIWKIYISLNYTLL